MVMKQPTGSVIISTHWIVAMKVTLFTFKNCDYHDQKLERIGRSDRLTNGLTAYTTCNADVQSHLTRIKNAKKKNTTK